MLGVGSSVPFILKRHARAKSVRFVVRPGGVLTITAPVRMSKKYIEDLVERNHVWITRMTAKFKGISPLVNKGSRKEYLQHKDSAHTLAQQLLTHFNKHYNFSYTRVSIRNQKTRWGSCSRTGAISFNYKIALLPAALAEYVVVHELCHLKEHNHSARFWALVAQTIPDWKERRIKLKTGRY